jgi:transposase
MRARALFNLPNRPVRHLECFEQVDQVSPEFRECAVRMVQEHRGEYPSLWAAVESIAPKIGCVPHTLLIGVMRQEVNAGVREGGA